jgi:hypothetical protein
MLLKSGRFFGAAPIKMVHQGVAKRGMCPLLFEGFEGAAIPIIAKNILDISQAKNGLRSILR